MDLDKRSPCPLPLMREWTPPHSAPLTSNHDPSAWDSDLPAPPTLNLPQRPSWGPLMKVHPPVGGPRQQCVPSRYISSVLANLCVLSWIPLLTFDVCRICSDASCSILDTADLCFLPPSLPPLSVLLEVCQFYWSLKTQVFVSLILFVVFLFLIALITALCLYLFIHSFPRIYLYLCPSLCLLWVYNVLSLDLEGEFSIVFPPFH